ncbi:hypothetical protein [Neptunicella marina]|uniref:Uncharacterized protein n=1 Tax=Neptunicella marina TaxID=2125989 RepID=A0A8J6IUE1_9ALTE|nr:hypothetical protein [Neptunicella marina]MBC3766097.1 hypothetical protein [Neptunicella marina]
MFANKHVIIALIVAPILAVLAYLGVDSMLAETPHVAKAGDAYKLLAKPNCRYESGVCSLVNGDVEMEMILSPSEQGFGLLTLHANMPLQGAKLALGNGDNTEQPADFSATSDTAQDWQLVLADKPQQNQLIRLVVAVDGVYYYGETPTIFFEYHTSFGEDFRREGTQ